MPELNWRRGLASAAALVLLPLAPLTASAAPAAPAAPSAQPGCSAAATIKTKLPNGTTWQMCWHNNPTAGLVLEDVAYQPKFERAPIQVLDSARLGEIHVPYDNGAAEYLDVTQVSLGSSPQPLKPKDCPGGTIKRIPAGGEQIAGLCVTTRARGFAHHGDSSDAGEENSKTDKAQGTDLVVYTVNAAGYYHYINQWSFSDDGTITVKSGATGNLSPSDYDAADGKGWPLGRGSRDRATSHQHNVFWRLNFAPDGVSSAKVERYDTKRTGTSNGTPVLSTTRTKVTKETAGNSSQNRWWRVVSTAKNADGHPRSWEIVHQNPSRYTGRKFTSNDLYFTQYRKCEKYPTSNRDMGGCGSGVTKFVNGEQLKHPVVWVNVGFHHIARDEDQTPMPVHWQGFQIAPRDVTSMSPLTPDRLHTPAHNGNPFD